MNVVSIVSGALSIRIDDFNRFRKRNLLIVILSPRYAPGAAAGVPNPNTASGADSLYTYR